MDLHLKEQMDFGFGGYMEECIDIMVQINTK
jgi:hypothetical protein